MNSAVKKLFCCCLVLSTIAAVTVGQHSPYSLQAAVNALHRRELQLALKDNYNDNPRSHYASSAGDDSDYWDEIESDRPSERHRLNRILAKYLENEDDNEPINGGVGGVASYENDFDDDNFTPIEERKRLFFRENEKNEPQYMGSVFREREYPMKYPMNSQQELTEKFLREIEEERDSEREERYKEDLKNLWEKYQQQENEIEDELFDDEKRKRFRTPQSDISGSQFVGPLMQKKRSYPVLPWLPYTKKKRFPVSKRSPKMPLKPFSTSNEADSNDQVSKDLQAIFGPVGEEKKKRSISSSVGPPSSGNTASTDSTTFTTTEKSHENYHNQDKRSAKTGSPDAEPPALHGDHSSHGHHQANGEDNHHHTGESSESRESEEEHDESHEEDHEDQSHEHGSEEEDDEKKKKRSVAEKKATKKSVETSMASKKKRANLEVVKEDQIIPGDVDTSLKKKSIDWSNYFGLDRRKKSIFPLKRNKKMVPLKKRSPIDLIADEKRKKRGFSEEKLDQMDSKLKSIEDLIIDETIKYTGAHEGINDPERIRELKDHVLSRLATAYNLEKMRRALDKLKQSVESENHLVRNEVEGADDNSKEKEKAAAAKRLSVKKEKVQLENDHRLDSSEKQPEDTENGLSGNNSDKKKKKKRNGGGSIRFSDTPNELNDFKDELGAGHFEPHNDVYLGRQNNGPLSINQCPIIDSMSERCRNVDILSGDIHQDLLPICGVHELCYLCGISPVACDLQYLSDADTICGHNNDCQSAARSVLMILRSTPGLQLGPKECLKNPCLYRVMREIGL